jgi:hypothetical protein
MNSIHFGLSLLSTLEGHNSADVKKAGNRLYQYNGIEPPALWKNSGLFRPDVLFNGHVFEFARFKNVATLLAFNKFSVFFACNYTHAGMLAGFLHRYWFGRPFRDRWVLRWIHIRTKAHFCQCLFSNRRYFKLVCVDVKCLCRSRECHIAGNG